MYRMLFVYTRRALSNPAVRLVGLVHHDVDPAHGVLHHAHAEVATELQEALEAALRELDRRLVPLSKRLNHRLFSPIYSMLNHIVI